MLVATVWPVGHRTNRETRFTSTWMLTAPCDVGRDGSICYSGATVSHERSIGPLRYR